MASGLVVPVVVQTRPTAWGLGAAGLSDEVECMVRIKHRQPLEKAVAVREGEDVHFYFENPQRAIAPGQYAVAYDGQICLGGGVINRSI